MLGNRAVDDSASEALLAGLGAPEGRPDLQSVALLLAELRFTATGPVPPPRGELARLFAAGRTPAAEDLPLAVGSPAHRPGRQVSGPARSWAAALGAGRLVSARLAALSLLTKVGVGALVAVASVTAAAGAGVLPTPAQDAVARVVHAVTGLHLPGAGGADRGAGHRHGAATPEASPTAHPTAPPASPANPLDHSRNGLSVAGGTPASPHVPAAVPPAAGTTGSRAASAGRPTSGPAQSGGTTPPAAAGTRPAAAGTRPAAAGTHPATTGTHPATAGTHPATVGTPPTAAGTHPAAATPAHGAAPTATHSGTHP